MFYIEKLTFDIERKPAFQWCRIYRCPEYWPLALMLKHLDKKKYRIVTAA